MDLKKIRRQASRLSAMVKTWEKAGEVEPIEKDIAMGLVREIYSELLFDKTAKTEPDKEDAQASCAVPSPAVAPAPEPDMATPAEEMETIAEVESLLDAVGCPEPEPEPIQEPEPQPIPEPEQEKPAAPRRVNPDVIRSLYGEQNAKEAPAPAPKPEAVHVTEPVSQPAPEQEAPKTTLADAMNGSRQTLGETLGNGKKDMASKIAAADTPTLKSAIGLNDRFLMIRDMFAGDSSAFDKTIADLDTFTDLDEAIIHIHDTYDWSADSEGVKLLVELLERKLG